jgi:hypothetical protein
MKYTENQVNAIKIFNEYVEYGDFAADYTDDTSKWFDYGWMDEILEVLTKKGWTQKTAEGTVGSLIEKGVIEKYEYMPYWNTPNDKAQWLWIVKWVDLNKEVA